MVKIVRLNISQPTPNSECLCREKWYTRECGGPRPNLDATHFLRNENLENVGSNTPLGRPGQPAELAPAYLLLASDEAGSMTGALVPVTGGWPIFIETHERVSKIRPKSRRCRFE
jgi:NAD(P)-dependent dehydrogenase (short-subunit alcohol dehydrogenase family)